MDSQSAQKKIHEIKSLQEVEKKSFMNRIDELEKQVTSLKEQN